mmetsp:Transcript_12415/g.19114  ORF Transcript_12415/g.19114 Transcript_12415/m.19114 type:complete len:458 (-) Transcript_12415:2956-4329(-)
MTPPVSVMTAGGAGQDPPKSNGVGESQPDEPTKTHWELELEASQASLFANNGQKPLSKKKKRKRKKKKRKGKKKADPLDSLYTVSENPETLTSSQLPVSRNFWLLICFLGIMLSFVFYSILLEYATSGGRKLHELSFLFITSGLYTLAGATGRHIRNETPTQIPPVNFAVLGLTSMGSTYCSVRSLRYVIYPIQVLAKSCKPVPVMLMGALMGKKYPLSKYLNVVMIVFGVALFMGGGSGGGKKGAGDDTDASYQIMGILLLSVSLCFDGATGAYEDKLMAVHSVGPFDLMYQIQLGKTILAGVGLVVFNQVHEFLQMCQDMGFLLVALGLSGALGQAFIFVTIAKFGALTCSIIGLARKVTTLVVSILVYGHALAPVQVTGLCIAILAMILNFWGKNRKKSKKPDITQQEEAEQEVQKLLYTDYVEDGREDNVGDVEMSATASEKAVGQSKETVKV